MQLKVETVNDLIGAIALRARQLVELGVNDLRAMHPEATDGPVRKTSKAECIEAILMDDFDLGHDGDQELYEPITWFDGRHE